MSNVWKLTRSERDEMRATLDSVVARIESGITGPPNPFADACNVLMLASLEAGEVEFAMTLAMSVTIARRGGEEGLARLVRTVVNLAADYDPTPEPIPGFDPKQN